MARPPKIENRSAELRCVNCDHHFVALVPQMGHYVAQMTQPVKWIVSSIDGAKCPECGSSLVEEKND